MNRRLDRIAALALGAGLLLAWTPTRLSAGDILRGGATAGQAPDRAQSARLETAAEAAKARANAQDALRRTTRAVESVQAMQAAARAAAQKGSRNLGENPNAPGTILPDVPDGLRPGGLEPAPGLVWSGAEAPVESAGTAATRVLIKQNRQQALLHWKTFNVGRDTTVVFDQSAGGRDVSKWIAFNKISDPSGNPTQILGSIRAPGQVYLINQNGIIFGAGSQINTKTLVASALPINDNLLDRGLLNNPDMQFLFSSLPLAAGAKGTPAFTPPASLLGRPGDVTVQAGARLTSPVGEDGNGGRILLVGGNVRQGGIIETPSGQAILAAGLQVGFEAHASSDPSLRGLDVYVGQVDNLTGNVENTGSILIPRGSAWLAGKSVRQNGIIDSTTSVSLNGRIEIMANHGAVTNPAYDPNVPSNGAPFLFTQSGQVSFGAGSVTRIFPETGNPEQAAGATLALRSRINVQGANIHLKERASIHAPNAQVSLKAGEWSFVPSPTLPTSTFIAASGQVYLDPDVMIHLAGTTGVAVPLGQSILDVQLRGSELAPSPLQREGILRGPILTVDLRRRGTYGTRSWIGTPLADVTGFEGLIERTVGQLTTGGGSLEVVAGDAFVASPGSVIDVSGGWVLHEGGWVQTSRVWSSGQLFDIASATPDRIYTGVFTGRMNVSHPRWGITREFAQALAPTGRHFEEAHHEGADAGSISIKAPSMALDGDFRSLTVTGPRQRRDINTGESTLPEGGRLNLAFQAQDRTAPTYLTTYPTRPTVLFTESAVRGLLAPFSVDASGVAAPLDDTRKQLVRLSSGLLANDGFSHLSVSNENGNIVLPGGVSLATKSGGSITLKGANVSINGSIVLPGGAVTMVAHNLSPYDAALINLSPSPVVPPPAPGRGILRLGSGAMISTAGSVNDERLSNPSALLKPVALAGGSISLTGYDVLLEQGSLLDVSGGAILGARGERTYGNAGRIDIAAGQDPVLKAVSGGRLDLRGELLGFSGAVGGTLAVQANLVQIGGSAIHSSSLVLSPSFFREGGFADYLLTGLGQPDGRGGFLPAVLVAPGTTIEPLALSRILVPNPEGGGPPIWRVVEKPVSMRSPAGLSLLAPGVNGPDGLKIRGDIVFGEGAVIRTDPGGRVAMEGQTVNVLGSILAPGGTITLKAGKNSSTLLFPDVSRALATLHIGPRARLSVAGVAVPTPDAFGRKTGYVLPGGSINVSGNIVAAAGAILDVSGARGSFDFAPWVARPWETFSVPLDSGLTRPPFMLSSERVEVASDGGLLRLDGGQMLFSDATLLGRPGGSSAAGGQLLVGSGRFYPPGILPPATDSNLVVVQSGTWLAGQNTGIGLPVSSGGGGSLIQRGYFSADHFLRGGFDSLSLLGSVEFQGPVSIRARGALSVADGGVLRADADVRLRASYIALGKPFPLPTLPEEEVSLYPFTNVAPTSGTGRLFLEARAIDVGSISMQGLREVGLRASGGDIRGAGAFSMAGKLTLQAAQIYPVTASKFIITAHDSGSGPGATSGSIEVLADGRAAAPLSAGGSLSLFASEIRQAGVLLAPFGQIQLGWDGTGTAPVDPLAGSALAVPSTRTLAMAEGSITSVAGLDPWTGRPLLVPYGVSPDGTTWIDPRGVDITASGLPEKAVRLSAAAIDMSRGATIDIRGGGDLFAYRWIEGNGGREDILAGSGGFAVVPGAQPWLAPLSPFNTRINDANRIAGQGPGYVQSNLTVGDRIYLAGSGALPAGVYTLLPARYALLPGGVLVTPTSKIPTGTISRPDGSYLVSGHRFNGLGGRVPGTLASQFELAPGGVIAGRAEYGIYGATAFLRESAANLGIDPQRLPVDAGRLTFQATEAMNLAGNVSSAPGATGRASAIDISSALDFRILGNSQSAVPGVISLRSDVLNRFGAGSLLIGGTRQATASGDQISVRSSNIIVDNEGSALLGRDLILAARSGITLRENSTVRGIGGTSASTPVSVVGDGSLLRVSADPDAGFTRSGTSGSLVANFGIEAGSVIEGGSVILDATGAVTLNPLASLRASSYTLNAGRISILLDDPGTLPANPGLVITRPLAAALSEADKLTLGSYSTIAFFGHGGFGTPGTRSIIFNSPRIEGVNHGANSVILRAGEISLGNTTGLAPGGPAASSSGRLIVETGTLNLRSGAVGISGFSANEFLASEQIIGRGTGSLQVANDLQLSTPLLTGESGSVRSLTATGALVATGSGGALPAAGRGLGARLDLTGTSVRLDTLVSLQSGALKVTTTGGDLLVGGTIDLSGISRTMGGVARFTDAGDLVLAANGGNIAIGSGSRILLNAQAGGGNAGRLDISVPTGSLALDGTINASGGFGGRDGAFTLDTRDLAATAALSQKLRQSGFLESQELRVRSGDVVIDGLVRTRDFRLSADAGSILVSGTIDAGGTTGGNIRLAARNNLTLANGAVTTVAAERFNAAGQGGSITLEAGTSSNGIAGTGTLHLASGSLVDLGVQAFTPGDQFTPGSSAYQGQFTGKLHLRAPQNAAGTDLLLQPLAGEIRGASSILAEGYRIYDLTGSGGTITTAIQTAIRNNGIAFLGANGSTSAGYPAMLARVLGSQTQLEPLLVLAPGAEILNRNGNLTLGTTASTTTSDWDLSGFRFGPRGAPGVLTLRASGNLVFNNALSDGFAPTLPNTNGSWLWLARMSNQNSLLPANAQSWTYRMAAGADTGASSFTSLLPVSTLGADAGSFLLGKNGGANSASGGANALTSSLAGNLFQVVRTGSGSIDIRAARDLRFQNQFAAIYTAGTRVSNLNLGGTFDVPVLTQSGGEIVLGAAQQNYPAIYSLAGGNLDLRAGGNIERVTRNTAGVWVPDSVRTLPNNWLYRRGHVDPLTGEFAVGGFGSGIASTTWWVDFSNFFQGVGALGGGNVNLTAGNNISNVDAVAPTNARASRGRPDASSILELGGGDISVRAGANIDAGVYYVERGRATLTAGGAIVTNPTRSPSLTNLSSANPILDPNTWLPTALFVGKGTIDINARGDILLGPVANPFLLPQGLGNSFWNKTYFSTYAPDSAVRVASLGGDITLRQSTTLPGSSAGTAVPILQAWLGRQHLLVTSSGAQSASFFQPWLRIVENSVEPFGFASSLMPPSLRATAFSGDLTLTGNFTLAPAARGNLELAADGNIIGLAPNGLVTPGGSPLASWGAARLNLSDADPNAIPTILQPFSYQNIVGTTVGQAIRTRAQFLEPLDRLFRESGATLGAQAVLQTKQALHGPGPVHLGDANPVRISAETGDISGLTLFAPKASRIFAGRDISDIAFYLQNIGTTDSSVVAAGRDVIPYNANTPYRVNANRPGNIVNLNSAPLAGDIHISGPGSLQVLAGRNLDLGTGPSNPDGTGTGINSIGNARNPSLGFDGAHVIVGAGIGPSAGLSESSLDFDAFISRYVRGAEGQGLLAEIDGASQAGFDSLPEAEQNRIALELFFLILRDAGRNQATDPANGYARGFEAIATLFPSPSTGDIFTRGRDVRTRNGGNITIFAPGGGLTLATSNFGNPLSPPGVITESGGNVSIFTDGDVNVGIGRIFTLRGGNQVIWSSNGNIAAGSAPKTVQSAPPTRVIIDPQSGAVQTDLAGLATGGGIGVLATVAGVEPGDVDLIAPFGVVDAGDAGIRSSGNLSIAANAVLNAGNITVTGNSAGVPAAPVVSAPNVGGLTAASNSAAATSAAAQAARPETNPAAQPEEAAEEPPSIITVEVLGYGGSSLPEDEEEEDRKDESEAEQTPATPGSPSP